MRISIVILTKDRPQLLVESLKFVKESCPLLFEIIVSDTSKMHAHQNEEISRQSRIENLFYIKRDPNLSAVSHWDCAINEAKGDYIFCLTDKMMILPNTIRDILDILEKETPDIISWPSLDFIPNSPIFSPEIPRIESYYIFEGQKYVAYDPIEALQSRASAEQHRGSVSSSEYSRGKICFGGYSRWLVDEIMKKSGSVCSGATHDYSAMVKALGNARSALQLKNPGIIHVHLPIEESTGSRLDYYSKYAKHYIDSLSERDLVLKGMLIPDLYFSTTNLVSYDFLVNLQYAKANIDFNVKNWLSNIATDLCRTSRIWENRMERNSQLKIFHKFVRENCNTGFKVKFQWSFFILKLYFISRLLQVSAETKGNQISYFGKLILFISFRSRGIIYKSKKMVNHYVIAAKSP